MSDEIKKEQSGAGSNPPRPSTESVRQQAIDKAKDIASKTQDVAKHGFEAAKKKFEEAGGIDGMKAKGMGILREIKAGFVPDEGATGFKTFTSRVKNLWKSGKTGKGALAAIVVIVGLILFVGDNDEKKALVFFKKANECMATDAKQAIMFYTKAAKLGNSDAQTILFVAYKNGEVVEKDMNQAIYWLKKAVMQENAAAQFEYGCLYREGVGVEEDADKAFKLFLDAAEGGHAEAQFNVALCYYKAMGVKQDLVASYKWAIVSYASGCAQASQLLARLPNEMDEDQVNTATEQSEKIVKKLIAKSQKMAGAKRPPENKNRVEVFGVYIGMDRNDAMTVLSSAIAASDAPIRVMPSGDGFALITTDGEGGFGACGEFRCSNGRVEKISCGARVFGVGGSGLPNEPEGDLARQYFEKEYGFKFDDNNVYKGKDLMIRCQNVLPQGGYSVIIEAPTAANK